MKVFFFSYKDQQLFGFYFPRQAFSMSLYFVQLLHGKH